MPQVERAAHAHRHELYHYGRDLHADRLALAAAEQGTTAATYRRALALARDQEIPNFPLRGADLVALGVPPGSALGRVLDEVRAWWRGHDFVPDHAACLAEAMRRWQPEP